MLRLRLAEGMPVDGLDAAYSVRGVEARMWRALEGHIAAGRAAVVPGVRGEGGRRVRLTDPDGFLLSNDVISDLFVAIEPESSEDE